MKTTEQFDTYFQQVQQFARRAHEEPATRTLLLQFIEDEQSASNDDPSYEEFLKGDLAFHREDYQKALKHYLLSKSIPHYKLFCFRASAYLAKEAGNLSKAKDFAEKAIAVYANDVATNILLEQLHLDPVPAISTPTENAISDSTVPEVLQPAHSYTKILEEPQVSYPASSHSHVDTPSEVTMFSQSDAFSPSTNQDAASEQQLMRRLYSDSIQKPYDKQAAPIEQVTKLPKNISLSMQMPKRQRPPAHATTTEVLTHSIAVFHEKQEQLIGDYLDLLETRSTPNENALYVLQGWQDSRQKSLLHLLTQDTYRTAGGFFIRWNGKGVVINPGKHFLELFHNQGLHVRDINYVIVTSEDANTYAEIEEIYNLNYQLNQSKTSLQVIHYYLNPKAHEALAQKLKPNFKQERNMIHCLEIFQDSPEIEKVVLNEDIILTYFPSSKENANLAIRLELRSRVRETGDLQSVSVGYVSQTQWSAYLGKSLGHCDLLIASFGHTNLDDYSRNAYNDDSLGYNGTYSLMEAVQPQLLLCSDFDGREGDIRLEVVKLLRQQYVEAHPDINQTPIVLPADSKLVLDLMNLHVQCSVTRNTVHPIQISVIKTAEGGGHLQYLSPHCYT